MEPRCGLCEEPLGAGGGRLGGLNLCHECWCGVEDGPLAERGLGLQSRRWTEVVSTGKSTTVYHYLEMKGVLPYASGLELRLSREHFAHKVMKLFRKELQVGDPLFDDVVWVGGRPSVAAAALLQAPGLQDVILEILSERGWLEIQDQSLRAVQASADGEPDEATVRRAALVALHHVSRYLARVAIPSQ